jgi:hypothetical protein
MPNELAVRPSISILEIDGDKVRATDSGYVCLRDILNAVGIVKTAHWIGYFNARGTGIEYHDIGQPKPAAFINEIALVEMLSLSRKPKAKEKLRNIIIRLRAQSTDLIKSLIERIEKLEAAQKPKQLSAPLPQMTPETQCNRIISAYAHKHHFDYANCWNTSYQDLYYVKGHNVFAIARHNNTSKLDAIRKMGWGKELLELVQQRYGE